MLNKTTTTTTKTPIREKKNVQQTPIKIINLEEREREKMQQQQKIINNNEREKNESYNNIKLTFYFSF